jgi:sigma-E factor negative regulatory protein RseC
VEADNALGAAEGEKVILSVPSSALLKASFQVYMIPVIGVLLGAGAAQMTVQFLAGDAAAGAAAGIGGVAGVLLAVAAVRAYRKRHPESATLRPRITRILDDERTLTPS